jgi:hypothetical protein
MMDFLDEIERIMEKDFMDLTNCEVAFLKARYHYLNDEEKRKLDEFLENVLKEDRGLKNEIDIDEVKLNNEIDEAKVNKVKIDKRTKAYKRLKAKEVKNAI